MLLNFCATSRVLCLAHLVRRGAAHAAGMFRALIALARCTLAPVQHGQGIAAAARTAGRGTGDNDNVLWASLALQARAYDPCRARSATAC
jgi:hypothetical protein